MPLQRPYDVVVLGIGLYGKRAAVELLSLLPGARLAIAGRSEAKLAAAHAVILERARAAAAARAALADAAPPALPDDNLAILCDCEASDAAAMAQLAVSTHVLVNCVADYGAVGDIIVRACTEAGTDYLDLSIDIDVHRQWAEEFGAAAVARGTLIVTCCGVDYVLADFGALLAAKLLSPPATLESVVDMMPVKVMREATFQTLIEVVAGSRRATAKAAKPAAKPAAPAGKRPPFLYWSTAAKRWTLPMVKGEGEVVAASQSHLAACDPDFRVVPYMARVGMPSLRTALGMGAGLMLLLACKWGPARRLIQAVVPPLLRWAGMLVNDPAVYEAVAVDQLRMSKLFVARGTRPAAGGGGPEPVERAMEIAVPSITAEGIAVAAAVCVQERSLIHVSGLATTAAAFHTTTYWQRLVDRYGVEVRVLEDIEVGGSGEEQQRERAKEE